MDKVERAGAIGIINVSHEQEGCLMKRCIWGVLLFALILSVSLAGTKKLPEPNNPYGVVVLVGGDDDSVALSKYFDWVRNLVGEWGYVRTGLGAASRNFYLICRAKHIKPIFCGGYPPPHLQDPNRKGLPKPDPDGTYKTAAQYVVQEIQRRYERGLPIRYFELMNEINGHWPAEVYAQYLYDVAVALHNYDPDIWVISCGMAGSGHEYYDKMLKAKPELADVVDGWGLHPYAANHPPEYDQDACTIQGYKWTYEVLKQNGVENPILVCTETGFELGNHVDERYPKITEEVRALYMVKAWLNYWLPDKDKLLTVCPFALIAWGDGGWGAWAYIKWPRGEFTPMYNAVAALPKPEGSDYMPRGDAVIKGRVMDDALDIPVDRVIVYTTPGNYAAETDEQGYYTIDKVPAGRYKVRAFKDGYVINQKKEITLGEKQTVQIDFYAKREGLVHANFDYEPNRTTASPFITYDGKPHPELYQLDRNVKHSGTASQKMVANPEGTVGIWTCGAYNSAWPGQAYSLEIWCKVQGLELGKDDKGVQISLNFANIHGVPEASGTITIKEDTDWKPVTITMVNPAVGRRIRVDLSIDAQKGTVWFDDLFVHYADLPLPMDIGRQKMEMPFGAISGYVKDYLGRPIPEATVSTWPGNFYAATDENGYYEIPRVDVGVYELRVFARDFPTLIKKNQMVNAGRISHIDFELLPDFPSELQNPNFEVAGAEAKHLIGWRWWGELDGTVSGPWYFDIMPYEGKYMLGMSSASNVKNGGVYQTIKVEKGAEYEVSCWALTKQAGGRPGDVAARIGVDPTGGRDPYSSDIIWTPWTTTDGKWQQIKLRIKATTPFMTIFIQNLHKQGITWNINAFDKVEVKKISE